MLILHRKLSNCRYVKKICQPKFDTIQTSNFLTNQQIKETMVIVLENWGQIRMMSKFWATLFFCKEKIYYLIERAYPKGSRNWCQFCNQFWNNGPFGSRKTFHDRKAPLALGFLGIHTSCFDIEKAKIGAKMREDLYGFYSGSSCNCILNKKL